MHLSSTINPLSKSEGNVPVSMFVFGAERVFLPVYEDYEDTAHIVAHAFGIKLIGNDSIVFSTSTLDVCDGKDAVIDPAAYPLMWTVLDEIHVSVGVINAVRKPDDDDEETRHPGKAPLAIQIPRSSAIPSSSVQQRVNGNAKPPAVLPQSSTLLVDIEVPRLTPNLPRPDLGKAKAKEIRVDFLDSPQDENDLLSLDSPSDHGGEAPPWKFNGKSILKGRGEGFSDESKAPAGSSSKNVEQSNPVTAKDGPRPQVKKEHVDKSPQAGESAQGERIALKRNTSHRSVRKEREPSIHTIDAVDDPHFEIYIRGPEPNQNAQFKMRGKHPVRKVLQAACKAFGLDYERSRLILSVAIEHDNGDLEKIEFECPADDTMTRCGVNAGSKLFVKVDPGSDE